MKKLFDNSDKKEVKEPWYLAHFHRVLLKKLESRSEFTTNEVKTGLTTGKPAIACGLICFW